MPSSACLKVMAVNKCAQQKLIFEQVKPVLLQWFYFYDCVAFAMLQSLDPPIMYGSPTSIPVFPVVVIVEGRRAAPAEYGRCF